MSFHGKAANRDAANRCSEGSTCFLSCSSESPVCGENPCELCSSSAASAAAVAFRIAFCFSGERPAIPAASRACCSASAGVETTSISRCTNCIGGTSSSGGQADGLLMSKGVSKGAPEGLVENDDDGGIMPDGATGGAGGA